MPTRAPATAAERRAESMSFGDQRSLVYAALLVYLDDKAGAGESVDIWIEDLAADWVVWCSYGDTPVLGPGSWKCSYTLDGAEVTFTSDPVQVVEQTTYEPVEAKGRTRTAPPAVRRARAELRSLADAVAPIEVRRAQRDALRNVRETRLCTTDFEMRDVPNGTGGNDLLFTGYASVTGDDASYEMEDWLGPWVESVAVGAFGKTLRDGCDTVFLLNHEGMTLARTKSGTLKLAEQTAGRPTGLHTEARLDPKNVYVKAMRSAVERGDLDEMSFAFRVTRQEWDEDYTRRWINEVSLAQGDVSLVNYGANPHTGGLVAMRNAGRPGPVDPRRYAAALIEVREGKTLSQSTLDVLQQVLELVSRADDAVDQAQPLLAELMGVPNPDEDDDGDDSQSGSGGTTETESASPLLAQAVLALARNREADKRRAA